MNDRLYRSKSERMLAGVAGGLAEMWGADPSLVRIVWAVLVILTGGIALVVYIVMAVVVPEGAPRPWPATGGPATAGDAFADPGPEASAQPTPPGTASGWTTQPRRSEGGRPSRDDSTAPLILGGLLVLLGAFFLVREFLPQIDFDWFWPAVLVVLGAVLMVTSVGRSKGGPGPGS